MKNLLILSLFVFIVSCKTEPQYYDITTDPTQNDLSCPDGIISFVDQIKPLVNAGCATSGCHDAQTHEEGIILDTYENIMQEVKEYKPNKSGLYKTLNASGEYKMPPPPRPAFTSAQKNLIREWILQGAKKTVCTSNECEIGGSSFSTHIYPMFQNKCLGCHNNNQQLGGINLASHSLIVNSVQNNNLLNCVKRTAGFAAMPPSNVLSECEVGQIEKWINEGSLDN